MEAAKAQNWAVEPQEEKKKNLALPAFYKQLLLRTSVLVLEECRVGVVPFAG
jgi:hypothetical protein